MKIQHTPRDQRDINLACLEVRCALSGEIPGDLILKDRYTEVPHDCNIESCPGRENLRRLDAAEVLLDACRMVDQDVSEDGEVSSLAADVCIAAIQVWENGAEGTPRKPCGV